MLSKSEQARADALADAETLRKMTRSLNRGFAYGGTDVNLAGVCALAELKAETIYLDTNPYGGGFWIRLAATHAFRAVPGLRG
jgi:hypothetical protein